MPELERTMATRPTAEWVRSLEAAGVPCGPVNDYAATFGEAQVRHRRLRVDVPRSDGSVAGTIASPLRLAGTPVAYDRAPPLLGEHTDEVLCGVLGRSPEEIAALRREGVV